MKNKKPITIKMTEATHKKLLLLKVKKGFKSLEDLLLSLIK